MGKTPTKATSTAVADPSQNFEEFAGAGLENVGSSDLLVPRLGILQDLSPQVKERKSEYIEGAKVGMIADLGTGELFPDGIWFLPVLYRKDYLEWAPRDSGKGLIGIHSDPSVLDDCRRNDRNQPINSAGNLIAETAQFYGINLSAGGRLSFIPMTSTQLKKAKRWNTLAMGEKLKRGDGTEYTAPLFYRTYNLTTAEESNNDGDWFGWKIARGPALPEITVELHGMDWRALMETAKDFRESLAKGAARGDLSEQEESSGEEAL